MNNNKKRKENAKVFAVMNMKGGVTKTTSAEAMAAILEKEGFRTLLIDFDPQASATSCLSFGVEDDAYNGPITEDILLRDDISLYGEYYLKELSPAPGYKINETEYEFFIDTDGKHEIIVVEDDPRIGTVTIDYEGRRGNADTGSDRGFMLPLYLGAVWLSLVMIGAAVRKEKQIMAGQ